MHIALAFPLREFDPSMLTGWGSFAVGAVAVISCVAGWHWLRWAIRLLLPKVALERDRTNAIRRSELSDTEAASARAEAASARNEARSWRSAYDELKRRVDDIEERVIPKFAAALKFIEALLVYIRHLEDAMSSAKVAFPSTERAPRIPTQLADDIPNS